MINQLFGSTDPSPLALIRKRRWWLRGEEHSGLFVDLIHAQHINWGLYKAPSIDCFFPGDQQLVSHRWRLFKHPFGWGQFCRCLLLCFIFSLHSRGCGCDAPAAQASVEEMDRQTESVPRQSLGLDGELCFQMKCCFIFKLPSFSSPLLLQVFVSVMNIQMSCDVITLYNYLCP